ncbi:hypothetical protein LAD12857_35100 [Lacrimispora amygdalina]|uniref:Uncharacterized protein n=2 Tax=Lacrimispora TaxID=2719231 RepID=A0ABX1W1C3_9FIRM|nr:hypothetical protein [Lacrimispora defluvii]NNJ33261.1 hypothetical protein [Lacrimispora defluvii]
MEYKEDYFDLPENTLIPMADGSTRPVSTVHIGDLVVDKNGNMSMVVNILIGLNGVEKLNHMNKIEKCEERVYTLMLEKQ